MNKMIFAASLAIVCAASLTAASAFAQSATANAPTTQTAQVATPAKPQPNSQRAVPAPGSRECLRDTGSLIPPPKGQCLPVAGTSYNQQDIQRTGADNVGQALQMLDPSVQVHGH